MEAEGCRVPPLPPLLQLGPAPSLLPPLWLGSGLAPGRPGRSSAPPRAWAPQGAAESRAGRAGAGSGAGGAVRCAGSAAWGAGKENRGDPGVPSGR